MKNAGITTVTHDPESPPMATDTDWAAVDAMSPAEIHEAALADLDAQPLAERELAGMTKLVNIKKLRERIGQTQEVFAATYHIPIGTLRDWEQRRKHPDAPARVYLQVIAQNPEAVAAMLGSAA
jgi:putative transcriptional regulator